MKLGRIPLGLLAAASLAACTISSDLLEGKKVDYKSAGQLPTLEIPPDLTTPARDNRYVVPDTGRSSATLSGYEAGRAQQVKTGTVQAGVLPTMDKIRIERAGSQRWLVISEPPEKLWPLVRDFWQENGFLIAISMPEAGVMETSRFLKSKPRADYATQSGPMLVIDGKLHPKFSANGPSLKVRNGVGVRDATTVVFAISNDGVSFGDFGRLFRDQLKCPNALFLDGSISSLHAPSVGRADGLWPVGPIVSARARK